ncbi:MAG: ABC transporter ATP-binding protein [Burkholderiaceae bacterium]|nr:ABC transporter ATP-binding protein [Burkholderiaceae bacterium]
MMLRVENVMAAYDGIKALKGVSLEVGAGEMVAVIGPNGAGKSTLLNCISGMIPTRGGQVWLDGQDLTGLPGYRVARCGLLQVPEGRQILSDLTVDDNLRLGELACRGRKSAFDFAGVLKLFPKLDERRWQLAGTLSGGEQQMLAIGRALMGGPKLLLLDEPSLGLSPLMTDYVFSALRTLNMQGLSILLVEQNAHRALESSKRAYVLDQGSVVHHGPSEELAVDSKVIAHYLGQEPSLEPA